MLAASVLLPVALTVAPRPLPPPLPGRCSVNGTISGYLGTDAGLFAGTSITGRWYPPSGKCPPTIENKYNAVNRTARLGDGVLWETGQPQESNARGFDVSPVQSVGLRFSLDHEAVTTGVNLYMMRNGYSGCSPLPKIAITLQEGDNGVPSGKIVAEASTECTSPGWNVVLESAEWTEQVTLAPNTQYWIVAKSDATPACNGVWVMGGLDHPEFISLSPPYEPDEWQGTVGYTTPPTAQVIGCRHPRGGGGCPRVQHPPA